MPGCIDCIEEKMDNGYTQKQAIFLSQYPPALIVVIGRNFYCFRHRAERYVRRREEELPTLGPRGPNEDIAR